MGPAGREGLWRQFGAALDMLENAVRACPDELWRRGPAPRAFWYLAYHTLFWLDYYLTGTPQGFAPPPPYTMGEVDPAGVYPERIYERDELLAYLEHGRAKCRTVLGALTPERAAEPSGFEWQQGMDQTELLLYNLRHLQHHVAQLQLLLRQETDGAPAWVSRAAGPLIET